MTRDEILRLERRELDDALAVKFGWRWVQLNGVRGNPWNLIPPEQAKEWLEEYVFVECPQPGNIFPSLERPRFSTTWQSMGLVVEAMRTRGWGLSLEIRCESANMIASFKKCGVCRREKADTAPRAVALAALLALEGAVQ